MNYTTSNTKFSAAGKMVFVLRLAAFLILASGAFAGIRAQEGIYGPTTEESATEAPVAMMSTTGNAPEAMMIQTSKPQELPRLVSMHTAHILDSYSLGFAGSGNIHTSLSNFGRDNLQGSIAIGLGGVTELGYELDEIHMVGEKPVKKTQGDIKLQLLKEGKYVPAITIGFGSTLNYNFAVPTENIEQDAYKMTRYNYNLMMSKGFEIAGWQFSVHPGVHMLSDNLQEYTNASNNEITKFNNLQSQVPNFLLGFTWQKNDRTMFILEGKTLKALDQEQLVNGTLDYQDAVQGNLAVRNYIRNWLFVDAGIRSYKELETNTPVNTEIHANITGSIPLKSVANRITSWWD